MYHPRARILRASFVRMVVVVTWSTTFSFAVGQLCLYRQTRAGFVPKMNAPWLIVQDASNESSFSALVEDNLDTTALSLASVLLDLVAIIA